MKVLLSYKNNESLTGDYYSSLLPVGLLTISAFLKVRGVNVRVANFTGMDRGEINRILKNIAPSVVGISQFTHNRTESLELADQVKKLYPRTVVVMGGAHATFCAEEVLLHNPSVDIVVCGEGEHAMQAIVDRIAAGENPCSDAVKGIAFRDGDRLVFTGPGQVIADIDSIPPAYAGIEDSIGVDVPRQLEYIITTRGCPSLCHFCSSPAFWGRTLRFRSPDAIREELCHLRNRYGMLYFSIRDDTFTADRKRVIELCRKMVENELYFFWNCQSRVNFVDEEVLVWMKRAGCECIQFGVESGSEKVLASLGKRVTESEIIRACQLVRKVGMNLSIYLITGVPGETDEDVDRTVALVKALKPHDGLVSPLAYYPGTQLYLEAKATRAVSADAFMEPGTPGIYVRNDEFTQKAMERILMALDVSAQRNAYNRSDFARHEKVVGFSHATNLLAGELCEREQDFVGAEHFYRAICRHQPLNPLGWFALGELYANCGNYQSSRQALLRVTELSPTHAPAFALLGHLAMHEGRLQQAKDYLGKATQLDKWDKKLAEMFDSLGKRAGKRGKKRTEH